VPLKSESGYFMMADISAMRGVIPEKYLLSHEYEEEGDQTIDKNQLFMPDGRVPLDLAVCRWMAMEKKSHCDA